MSIIRNLQASSLGLKGVDLQARDGKALDTLRGKVFTADLSTKGETPGLYTDEINATEVAAVYSRRKK